MRGDWVSPRTGPDLSHDPWGISLGHFCIAEFYSCKLLINWVPLLSELLCEACEVQKWPSHRLICSLDLTRSKTHDIDLETHDRPVFSFCHWLLFTEIFRPLHVQFAQFIPVFKLSPLIIVTIDLITSLLFHKSLKMVKVGTFLDSAPVLRNSRYST